MTDTLKELRAALAERYRIEREIGRGGMAVVYLACELQHHRWVALKVLNPDLTHAVAAERFVQEIRTTAHLTHPNILPIHDSGRAGNLLYYVTPYVRGETLRARLTRDRRLPVDEAVAIAAQVADALSFAHEHGVVHRDIKPENILLTPGNQVWLADFGLARALDVDQRLTQTGILLGSPLYMSPEQVSGSRAVDGRADIYSLGCVLYEMLVGEPPFTGDVQSVLAQHVSVAPGSIMHRNKEVSAGLARAVGKALAKTPDDRFANAREFRVAIARGGDRRKPRLGTPQVRWLRASAIALLIIAVLATALLVARGRISRAFADGARQQIILAEFESPTGDTLLARVVTEAIRIDFMRSRVLRPLDARTQVTSAVARTMAEREGVPAVLLGTVSRIGQRYILSATIENARSREALAAARAQAADSSAVIFAIDELSKSLRDEMGERLHSLRAEKPLADVTTRSMPALRKYTLAVRAIDGDGNQEAGMALLREAIEIDPSFAMAHRKLAITLDNSGGQLAAAIAAYENAYRYRTRLTDRERHLAEAAYYDVLEQWRAAATAYQQLLSLYPDDVHALINLGYVYATMGDHIHAREYYARAVRTDSTSSLAAGNLITATFNGGDVIGARRLLQQFAARFPGNPRVYSIQAYHAAAVGDYDSAQAAALRLLREHTTSSFWTSVAQLQLGSIAMLRNDHRSAESHFLEAARIEAANGAAGEALRIEAVFARSLLLAGHPARARSLIDEALRKYPVRRIPMEDRPLVELASFYADDGNVTRATEMLRALESTSNPRLATRIDRARQLINAAIFMARRDGDAAVRLLRSVQVPGCPICLLPELGRAYEQAAMPDSALVAYQKYLNTPFVRRVTTDALWRRYVSSRITSLTRGSHGN